jgi:hypothetical protein
MMGIEWAVILMLMVVVFVLLYFIDVQRRHYSEVINGLLDRVMSRNYDEYADIEIRKQKAAPVTKVVSIDELKNEILAHQEEQGIPV